jgi:hypothetical protein
MSNGPKLISFENMTAENLVELQKQVDNIVPETGAPDSNSQMQIWSERLDHFRRFSLQQE